MGTEKNRKELIEKLKRTFLICTDEGRPISRRKIIAQICMDYGYTVQKAEEYLRIFIDSGFLKQESDKDTLIVLEKSDIEKRERAMQELLR